MVAEPLPIPALTVLSIAQTFPGPGLGTQSGWDHYVKCSPAGQGGAHTPVDRE
jgi:hypothetical protein